MEAISVNETKNGDVRIFNKNLTFAKSSVDYKKVKSNTIKKYTIDQVIKALEDPVKNYKTLQETSLYLSSISMTYRRLLENFSSMVNYSFMLKPTVALITKKNKSNALKNYYDSAGLIEKIDPKNFKWMSKVLWEVGELYLYEIEDKNGIVYKRMPEQICRISSVVGNSISLYSIDLSTLSNKDLLATMPPEVQSLYERFTKKQIKDEELVDGKWYELTKNAVAFNAVDSFMVKGYPLLSPLFPSLMALEESNRRVTSDEEVDNLKIIHMQYEVDEEGNAKIDPMLITQFHNSVKENLPDGCCVSTNPLKMNVYNTKNSQQSTNYRKEIGDIVYSSVGSSRELFNGERNSNMAIEMSTKSDEIFALTVAKLFENYVNYKLNINKKTSYYQSKLLPITYYNEEDYQRRCETSLSFAGAGNMLRYMASLGYTPLEAMAQLQIERDLGLEDLFKPALNGYNAGADEVKENGRPSASENGDVAELE